MSATAPDRPTAVLAEDGVTIARYDGPAVLAGLGRWSALYEQVYRDSRTTDHTDPPIAGRPTRHAQRPGFVLVGAHAGDQPVGFVYGYPLPGDTLWWDGLDPEPDPAVVAEWPGRTLGVCEGLILAPWRQLGLTGRMYLDLLTGRSEERLAVHIAHDNELMLSLATSHGAIHVGDLDPFPGWRRHAAYVIPLRPEAAGNA